MLGVLCNEGGGLGNHGDWVWRAGMRKRRHGVADITGGRGQPRVRRDRPTSVDMQPSLLLNVSHLATCEPVEVWVEGGRGVA